MKENLSLKAHITDILKPYWGFVAVLALFTIAGNAIGLFIPKLISRGIDAFDKGTLNLNLIAIEFIGISVAALVFTYLQGAFQTYLSELVARNIRTLLVEKISYMSYARLEKEAPSKLLTNLTSDIDAVKSFISQGLVTIISSAILIIGASGLLIAIDWKLALAVLILLPIISILFVVVFRQLGPLFRRGQEIIDRMNSIISQSIVGAALIRVLDSEKNENQKFQSESTQARENGRKIVKLFSILMPTVILISNLAILVILALGSKFVIGGSLSLGNFIAFNIYVIILIFPIIMLGFVSQIISRAQASYGRISKIFSIENDQDTGQDTSKLMGNIEARDITLSYGEKTSPQSRLLYNCRWYQNSHHRPDGCRQDSTSLCVDRAIKTRIRRCLL